MEPPLTSRDNEMSKDHTEEELRAIRAELEALGEDPEEDFPGDLDLAQALGDVLRASREGSSSVEALSPSLDRKAQALQPALKTLHMLRADAPEAELSPKRADALWSKVQKELPSPGTNVLPFRRKAAPLFWIAAAAVILLAFGGVLLTQDLPTSHEAAPATIASAETVEQVELTQAEAKLATVESQSLRHLVNGTTARTPGDHYLRNLRHARQRASTARHQARARRL